MSGEHTPTLQNLAADRDWWSADAGRHYHELAHWLRGIAAKCRLPYSQRELLDLLRSGNVHSADGWRAVLEPVVIRYQGIVKRLYSWRRGLC